MDMSAVGNAASAPKDKTGLSGDESFTGRVTIAQSDNGGFIVSASYERKKPGNSKGQTISDYCPDKQLTFDDWPSAQAAIAHLYGQTQGTAPAAPASPDADAGDVGA